MSATRATSPSTFRTSATSSFPGRRPFWIGREEEVADEIQHFLSARGRPVRPSDRVLATVLFTDIVGVDRAGHAELGDGFLEVAASSSATTIWCAGRWSATAVAS